MSGQIALQPDHRPGDKVRIRRGPSTGQRGIIRDTPDGLLELELHIGGTVSIHPHDVTNFSLAARRAWQSMPKRSGRPRLATPRKRSVSLRLDIDVWCMLARAAEDGLIRNREHAINTWLRERLAGLVQQPGPPRDASDGIHARALTSTPTL